MEIELIRIQVDHAMSPRSKLNSKHVDEFVEMAGEWPDILVRPIQHEWYTHQLIEGFHRFEAAQKLNMATIEAQSEEMDDATALARALRENLHGLPITPEDRQARVVMLRKQFRWELDQITHETGVKLRQVEKYLQAVNVDEVITHSMRNSDDTPPTLSIDQKAALAPLAAPPEKRGPKPKPAQGPQLMPSPAAAPKPDPKAAQREAAQAALPAVAKIVEKEKDTKVIRAISDAVLDAPEHAEEIAQKAVTDNLAPDAIRHMGKVLASPETPPALAEDIVRPGTMIRDAAGNMAASEPQRMIATAFKQQPEIIAQPFTSYLAALHGYLKVNDDMLTAWLETADPTQTALCESTFTSVERFFAHVREYIKAQRRDTLRLLS
jgi:ParB-like chromosome segregation protein Spo0J